MRFLGWVFLILIGIGLYQYYSERGGPGGLGIANEPECGPRNVTVSKLKGSTENRYVRVTGLLRHNCAQPVGVQLKWTVFFKDGSVAFTESFWPGSTTNIRPGEDYPFQSMNSAPQEDEWKFRIEPVAIHVW